MINFFNVVNYCNLRFLTPFLAGIGASLLLSEYFDVGKTDWLLLIETTTLIILAIVDGVYDYGKLYKD